MVQSTTPAYWEEAKSHLSKQDHVMGAIITQYQGEYLQSRGNAFETLARAVTGQQISVKAADSIWKRLEAALGNVTPSTFWEYTEEELHNFGFSRQKILYLRGIAEHFQQGNVTVDNWHDAPDHHVIKELTAIKGIGQWTAEMFLIFYLLKPDVLPLADIGLQKAIMKHYNGGDTLTIHAMQALAEPWRPYRTVATWYLWRSLDPVPVEY